jgi:Rod binding domain-containing protein
MSIKVAPLMPQVPPQAPPRETEKPADAKLHKMAQEFEAVFVRQLLSAAKLGGSAKKEDGYDGMAVDALASAVTGGGGLGLARQIEEALSHAGRALPAKK